jgi:two-component system NtrC family response regulator
VTLDDAVHEAERVAILAALTRCNHHRENTARLLGISIRTLQYKMNRLALQ